jgi:hypothetical protein
MGDNGGALVCVNAGVCDGGFNEGVALALLPGMDVPI